MYEQSHKKIKEKREKKKLTLARFVDGPANGVPSLFSLVFVVGTDSSRTGLTFRSAYFLQFVPQTSHKMLVGRPLGAFHHVLDSRVLQAPQLGVLDGCAMMEESSSEWPTCWPSLASSCVRYRRRTGLLGGPAALRIRFCWPRQLLGKGEWDLSLGKGVVGEMKVRNTFSSGRSNGQSRAWSSSRLHLGRCVIRLHAVE